MVNVMCNSCHMPHIHKPLMETSWPKANGNNKRTIGKNNAATPELVIADINRPYTREPTTARSTTDNRYVKHARLPRT